MILKFKDAVFENDSVYETFTVLLKIIFKMLYRHPLILKILPNKIRYDH